MLRHYLILFRTFWLGGLWCSVYLVRPLLEQKGFFPQHGIEVLHVMVGFGAVIGSLMLALSLVKHVGSWRQLPLQLLAAITLLSWLYFALMPWWKLQMMILHAISLLAVVWLLIAPQSVLVVDAQVKQRQS